MEKFELRSYAIYFFVVAPDCCTAFVCFYFWCYFAHFLFLFNGAPRIKKAIHADLCRRSRKHIRKMMNQTVNYRTATTKNKIWEEDSPSNRVDTQKDVPCFWRNSIETETGSFPLPPLLCLRYNSFWYVQFILFKHSEKKKKISSEKEIFENKMPLWSIYTKKAKKRRYVGK